jgi:hypothetical protein
MSYFGDQWASARKAQQLADAKTTPSQYQVAGPDPRAWQAIKANAMQAPGSSPWLTMARAGQANKNITQANALAGKSAWGGMPTGEAAIGNAVQGGIQDQASMYGGNAAADVGLQRQNEQTRQASLAAAPGQFNDLQYANKANIGLANQYGANQNDIAGRNYARAAKTSAADMLAAQYKVGAKK